jgi:ABC-2 type transport system permease protein
MSATSIETAGDEAAGMATPAAAGPGTPAPTGTVHDLGYKRYLGTRLPQGLRWRVIMRQQIAYAWKTWWRWKLPMVSAVVATLVAGAVMYVASDTVMNILKPAGVAERGGDMNPIGQMALRFIDGILPLSVVWYCKIGFIASMTVAASTVAADIKTGAFSFYFARSVRPVDYVVGKAAGLMLLVLAGPLLLALLRVGLSDDTSQIVPQLRGVLHAGAVGVLATLIYSIIPLGFSAIVADRRWAIGLWALYYVAVGSIMSGLAMALVPQLAALDLAGALARVSFALFDVSISTQPLGDFSVAWDLGSIALHTLLALGLVSWRVAKAARDGVGGMS